MLLKFGDLISGLVPPTFQEEMLLLPFRGTGHPENRT